MTAGVTGLVPNALYHIRVVATNATGTTFGPDQTFTTPADPAPPAPVLAKNVDAKPVSGKVFLLVGGKLVPLTEADQLRAGTVVDTRNGSLQLTTASSQKHKQQTGTFSGAIFKITQVHSGLTTLSLVENAFTGAPSFASCKSKNGKAQRRGLEQDVAAAALERHGQVQDQGPLRRRDRSRDEVDDRRSLRRDADARSHRLGRGQRLRPPQDDRASRRAELSRPGDPPKKNKK